MLPQQWNCISLITITIITTIFILWLDASFVAAGVARSTLTHSLASIGHNLHTKTLPDSNLGLYNNSDKVLILTKNNFDREVLQRNRSILIEFYNSYCGHCRKFAPLYKQLAKDLYGWRDLLPLAALDCAADENNEICRYYEVMAYPTLRYFEPFFTPGHGHFGKPINITKFDVIHQILADLLSKVNHTRDNNALKFWPNFEVISNNIEKLYLEKAAKYLAIIFDDKEKESTMPKEVILHLSRWPDIEVRRTHDPSIFNINDTQYKMLILDSNRKIYPYKIRQNTTDAFVSALKGFLKQHNITERPSIKKVDDEMTPVNHQSLLNDANDIIKYVKRNKHIVYQADLERAVYVIIHNEIPISLNISGPKLIALQNFLDVLDKYNPLGAHGQTFLTSLNSFVKQQANDGAISGGEFSREVKHAEALNNPIFSSNQYIGCIGSVANTRGFTCSLWQLFHYLTVQSAENQLDYDDDPLEVLRAVQDYVKYFFGCTECSQHFQEMAAKHNLTHVSSRNEAILWLWTAHNLVNQRLAGDATEDPAFPKIQFPSPSSCAKCYTDFTNTSTINNTNASDIKWHRKNVLKFLKNIYNPLYISRYGVNNITALSYRTSSGRKHDHEHGRRYGGRDAVMEKLRSKRMISNVFNDLDIRMGMLLYGFCIVMLVLAFKLFTLRGGYRKKSPYCHDMLGKA